VSFFTFGDRAKQTYAIVSRASRGNEVSGRFRRRRITRASPIITAAGEKIPSFRCAGSGARLTELPLIRRDSARRRDYDDDDTRTVYVRIYYVRD